MALTTVLVFSSVLGGASFLIGLLPLTVSFSRKSLARLSMFGTGLLLGASLGVIVPEGVETLYANVKDSPQESPSRNVHLEPPTSMVAMCLLSGFLFMLCIEQAVSQLSPVGGLSKLPSTTLPSSYRRPNISNSSQPISPATAPSITESDFDLDLDVELSGLGARNLTWSSAGQNGEIRDPRLMTSGLVLHSLVDGLALGASLASSSQTDSTNKVEYEGLSNLSVVVFTALALHKAPASLALTSTLMTYLPIRVVRTHLIVFSLATPLSTIVTYLVLQWFANGDVPQGAWTGKALLFSGGTFLYVATLLSPLSTHAHPGEASAADADLSPFARLGVIAAGMYAPALLTSLVGHGHDF